MKKIFIISVIFTMIFTACKKNDEICNKCDGWNSKIIDMWIDAQYGPCDQTDTIRPHCLMVQYETYNDSLWQPFNDTICGFNYTPGIWYHLEVKRKKIDQLNNQPIYKYCLVSIIETKQKFLK